MKDNSLRGYTKVFVYTSKDGELKYVSRSLTFLDKFFINRYNGDKSNFIYEGEMMVKLKKYYAQSYCGVYKRVKDDREIESIKQKKDWVYPNLGDTNIRKLQKVIVSWKHTEKIKTDKGTTVTFKFPKISYKNDDLKGRARWSNVKWLKQAVSDYIEHYNYDPKTIEETFVKREY
jgi:hypothetical protein